MNLVDSLVSPTYITIETIEKFFSKISGSEWEKGKHANSLKLELVLKVQFAHTLFEWKFPSRVYFLIHVIVFAFCDLRGCFLMCVMLSLCTLKETITSLCSKLFLSF